MYRNMILTTSAAILSCVQFPIFKNIWFVRVCSLIGRYFYNVYTCIENIEIVLSSMSMITYY